MILDHNTGSKVTHYVAHHGNLKFLRYLKLKLSAEDLQLKDDFNCTLIHYGVRQGHLPILIYCVETLKIDLDARDHFGYTALDYSLIYVKPHCFVYLFYKCNRREVSLHLLPQILKSLIAFMSSNSNCESPQSSFY